MKPVFISLTIGSDLQRNLRKAFEFAGLDFLKFDVVRRTATGKPFLVFKTARNIGYSLSHARDIEAIALLNEERDIGIDLEVLPAQKDNPDFLETVACPEDVSTLKRLGGTGYDAGIALWVIKEAALKCTGDVMTDPRHISVTNITKNLYRVRPSALANAPQPEIDVALYILLKEIVFLLAVAMPAGALKDARKFRSVEFSAPGWTISEFPK